ncbi:hypothetical protein Bbelb_200280 [Branchiostoma belcheri]|nr:hypothetical protein Bbelb_200280 [Branchiostoma belcheri]
MRRPTNTLVYKAYHQDFQNPRPRGRPPKRWKDQIQSDTGITLSVAEAIALDRTGWRNLTEGSKGPLTDCGTTHQAETKLQSTFLMNDTETTTTQAQVMMTVANMKRSYKNNSSIHQIVTPIENRSYNKTVTRGSNPRQPVAHQSTLPVVNKQQTYQCTSSQGIGDEDLVPPGEDESTLSLENSENHSAVELYQETVAVSEQCVELNRTQTAESTVYTCTVAAACFLRMSPNGLLKCSSPSQLRGRHLSTVSAELTDCGTTHQAEAKLQSTKNGTFLINDLGTSTTQTQLSTQLTDCGTAHQAEIQSTPSLENSENHTMAVSHNTERYAEHTNHPRNAACILYKGAVPTISSSGVVWRSR